METARQFTLFTLVGCAAAVLHLVIPTDAVVPECRADDEHHGQHKKR